MELQDYRKVIEQGKTALGIELGSTRIKGVLTDDRGRVLAVGVYDWENSFVNQIWTYDLGDAVQGLQGCYRSLVEDVEKKYGLRLAKVGALGISAMMHGYIATDRAGRQLAPFQTWRNTNTQQAADQLTERLGFNIPLRWSAAHLYQRILDGESHVKEIAHVATLSAYIHQLLSGEYVIGIGDASGMFPIDSRTMDYHAAMADQFDALTASHGFPQRLHDIFPKVLTAGQNAGYLTERGARLLDETGFLQAGIPMCPPEGDAGTGMVATNSVRQRTGNVSAGTSTFAMVVLEKPLEKLHREIDMVTTPSGYPVAMSHANNGTTDLNAWVDMFREFAALMGYETDLGQIYEKLYTNSLTGDADCGGLLPYGYYSGENVTRINEGRPIFLRKPESQFNLANFMRAHLFTSLAAVKMGLDILIREEGVTVDSLMGHGGFFKTRGVGQRYLSASAGVPVTVLDNAGEGGAWGIALLAAYLADRQKTNSAAGLPGGQAVRQADCPAGDQGIRLEDYLDGRIFAGMRGDTIMATPRECQGFEEFMNRYRAGLDVERAAIACL